MVCAAKGYPFVATMVETFSVERRKIMRALGAKVIPDAGPERGTGMVRLAASLAKNTAGTWRGSSRTRRTRPITARRRALRS